MFSTKLKSYCKLLFCVWFPIVTSTNVTKLFVRPMVAGVNMYIGKGQLVSTEEKWTIQICDVFLRTANGATRVDDQHKFKLFQQTFSIAIRSEDCFKLIDIKDEIINSLKWMPVLVDENDQTGITGASYLLSVPVVLGNEAILLRRVFDGNRTVEESICSCWINQTSLCIFFKNGGHETLFFKGELQNVGQDSEFKIIINGKYKEDIIIDKTGYNFQISDKKRNGEIIVQHWELRLYAEFISDGNLSLIDLDQTKIWIATPKIEAHKFESLIGRGIMTKIGNFRIWKVILTRKLSPSETESDPSLQDSNSLKQFVGFIYIKVPKASAVFSYKSICGEKNRNEWRRFRIYTSQYEAGKIVIFCTLGDPHLISNIKTRQTAFQVKTLELSIPLAIKTDIAIYSDQIIKDEWYLLYDKTSTGILRKTWAKVAFANIVIQDPIPNLFDFVLITFVFCKYIAEGPMVYIKFNSDKKERIAFGMINYDKTEGRGNLWIQKLVGKKGVLADEKNISKLLGPTNWRLCSGDSKEYELGIKSQHFWGKPNLGSDKIEWSYIHDLSFPFLNDVTHQIVMGFDFGTKATLFCEYAGKTEVIPIFDNSAGKRITLTDEYVEKFRNIVVISISGYQVNLELLREQANNTAFQEGKIEIEMIQSNEEIHVGTENAFKFPIYQFFYILM